MKPTNHPLRFGAVTAGILWLIFSIPTIASYYHSPPDSLKAVGYVFIALYGLFVGVIGGLAVTFLQNGVRFADRRIKGIVSFVFAAFSERLR